MVARTPASPIAGQLAVVTGATSGLGREIAGRLAALGARTVLVGRGSDRTTTAAREIAEAQGGVVESVPVDDLALRAEQRRLVAELTQRYPRIDIVVNNAGGLFRRREVTADGLERTFALNVLAPFVLTQGLLPSLRAADGGRVVNIASAAHRGQRLELDDLQGERRYSGWSAYGRSKLALILLTREFARRLPERRPTVNAVHPGFVRTGFAQNNGGAMALFVRFFAALGGRSVQRGAETPVFAAVDPSLRAVSGAYLSDLKVEPGSEASRDAETARRLYDACAALAAG